VALCAAQITNIPVSSTRFPAVAELLALGLVVGTLTFGFNLPSIGRNLFRHGTNPIAMLLRKLIVKPGSDIWFQPVPTARLEVFVTESGLRLLVPRDDNRCVNAPLPCTPHPASNLRVRKDENLGSGFITDGQWQPMRWPNPWASFLSTWRAYQSEGIHSR
jgi:hypothetical protein